MQKFFFFFTNPTILKFKEKAYSEKKKSKKNPVILSKDKNFNTFVNKLETMKSITDCFAKENLKCLVKFI